MFAVDGDFAGRPAVRELALRRRRSRLPWVYLVYRVRTDHVGQVPPSQTDVGQVPPSKRAMDGGPADAESIQLCRRRKAG